MMTTNMYTVITGIRGRIYFILLPTLLEAMWLTTLHMYFSVIRDPIISYQQKSYLI